MRVKLMVKALVAKLHMRCDDLRTAYEKFLLEDDYHNRYKNADIYQRD